MNAKPIMIKMVPVKDWIGEVSVYVGSLWAVYFVKLEICNFTPNKFIYKEVYLSYN